MALKYNSPTTDGCNCCLFLTVGPHFYRFRCVWGFKLDPGLFYGSFLLLESFSLESKVKYIKMRAWLGTVVYRLAIYGVFTLISDFLAQKITFSDILV